MILYGYFRRKGRRLPAVSFVRVRRSRVVVPQPQRGRGTQASMVFSAKHRLQTGATAHGCPILHDSEGWGIADIEFVQLMPVDLYWCVISQPFLSEWMGHPSDG